MEQKNFVIVGGSHGIGLGVVKRLTERGSQVTVLSRTQGELSALPHVQHIPFDVLTDELTQDCLPPIVHGMVYCPGSINLMSPRSLSSEAMLADFQLNVIGAIRCLQVALDAMRAADNSALVMFSSVAVAQGLKMHASVAASKGAIEGLTRSLAADLAPRIRVNCIAPALTDTPLAQRFLANDQKRAAMADIYPLKRYGTIDDIAGLTEFLLSDAASWITGQIIGADGGLSSVRV